MFLVSITKAMKTVLLNIAIRQTLNPNPVYIYSKSLKNYIYAEDIGKIFS